MSEKNKYKLSLIKKTALFLVSPNSLLLIAVGALVAIFIGWLTYNSTDFLYDVISILIILSLSALLATVVVRLIAGKTAKDASNILEKAKSRRDAVDSSISFLWENRQTLLTLAAFLFILSIFKGVVGVSNLMISYLELDNIRKQSVLLEAQTEAVVLDAVGVIDQRLDGYKKSARNLELVKKSWGSMK